MCGYVGVACFRRNVTPDDFGPLDTLIKSISKEKQQFERLEMKKEDLLEMFKVGDGKIN